MILDLHRQGLSITAIARRTGRDPKTERKYIARGLEPPAYGPRQAGRLNKLAPYLDYLRERIAAFPQLTATRLTREIRDRGYAGAYTAVKRFVAGTKHGIPRYSCSRAWMDNGGPHCIAFGGLRVDDATEEVLLSVVGRRRHRRCNHCRQGSQRTNGIRYARPLDAISKRRAMPPTGPSGNKTPRIPPTDWWLASSKCAGTMRWRTWPRWRAR